VPGAPTPLPDLLALLNDLLFGAYPPACPAARRNGCAGAVDAADEENPDSSDGVEYHHRSPGEQDERLEQSDLRPFLIDSSVAEPAP